MKGLAWNARSAMLAGMDQSQTSRWLIRNQRWAQDPPILLLAINVQEQQYLLSSLFQTTASAPLLCNLLCYYASCFIIVYMMCTIIMHIALLLCPCTLFQCTALGSNNNTDNEFRLHLFMSYRPYRRCHYRSASAQRNCFARNIGFCRWFSRSPQQTKFTKWWDDLRRVRMRNLSQDTSSSYMRILQHSSYRDERDVCHAFFNHVPSI